MALEHVNSGPATITYNGIVLGFSQDGADITYRALWGDIHSDDFGGAGGAPSDTQLLGIIGSVTASLTKYDAAEVEKLASFTAGGNGNDLPTIGTFMRQENKTATLFIDGTKKKHTFGTSFPREPQSLNAGTKFSTYIVQFEFWINSPTSLNFQAIT